MKRRSYSLSTAETSSEGTERNLTLAKKRVIGCAICGHEEGDSKRGESPWLFLLDRTREEKEPSVADQRASAHEYPRGENSAAHQHARLTAEVVARGGKFFLPFAKGESAPGRPNGSGRFGFYIDAPEFVAFRGVGGVDMAKIWHMLIIPKDFVACSCFGTEIEAIELKWVYDLMPRHAGLLCRMRRASLDFVKANEQYFKSESADSLMGKSPSEWLKEENIRLGFHSSPSVGYLHMHVLVGPLTEFGATHDNVVRWINLDSVLKVLEEGKPFSSRLPRVASQHPVSHGPEQ